MVVLLISPYGQQTLWQITPWTVIMGTGGHIIYGGVLGTFRADAAKRPWSLPYDKRRDPRPVTFLPEGWLLTTEAAPLAELAAAPRPTPKHAAPTSYVSRRRSLRAGQHFLGGLGPGERGGSVRSSR
jgi:hypothetical protein